VKVDDRIFFFFIPTNVPYSKTAIHTQPTVHTQPQLPPKHNRHPKPQFFHIPHLLSNNYLQYRILNLALCEHKHKPPLQHLPPT